MALTYGDVVSRLDSSTFEVIKVGGRITVLHVILPSGFEFIESTICTDASEYKHDVGAHICREKAISRLWELEMYRLQSEGME